MPSSDQDSFVTIAEVGQMIGRCSKLANTRKQFARKPPTGPTFNPNKDVPERWIALARALGIEENAHELPIVFEAGLDQQNPYLIELMRQFLSMAKLSCTTQLERHRQNQLGRRQQFQARDQNYQKELRSYQNAQKTAHKSEQEYLQQVRTKWGHLMKSLAEALRRAENNPARLSPKDAATVEILKRRGYVDVRNHTVDVRFGTLDNLDSDTIGEICKALMSSLRGIEFGTKEAEQP